MAAALRCEIFPADLDATVAFYVSVLGFELVRDSGTGHPWGLRDFRLLDPSGCYWRITSRAPHLR
jgi:catechol 2,3-dioxygenase-like lactoylglutathione lyase family enzyme